jgi:hypothetical protein
MVVNLEKSFSMKNEKEDPENPVYPGLTKPGRYQSSPHIVKTGRLDFSLDLRAK